MDDQRKVWSAIADSFDRTRSRPWPHVEAFLRGLPKGSSVLDLMAGNGRHAKVAQDAGHRVTSLDWSAPLVAKAPGAVLGDAVRLPFADASFDAALYVAGLHGLTTPDARAASLRELRRVLRPGTPAQVTVWSRDAPRFAELGQPEGPADVTIPWKGNGHDESRFYHLYTSDSLRTELTDAGFTVGQVEPVAIAASTPDNLVATVIAPK